MVKEKLSLIKARMDGIPQMIFIVRVKENYLFSYEFLNTSVLNNLNLTHEAMEEQIVKKAGNIKQAISAPWSINGHLLKITASIGIAQSSINGSSTTSVLREADKAMYDAKNAGKNLVHFNSSI